MDSYKLNSGWTGRLHKKGKFKVVFLPCFSSPLLKILKNVSLMVLVMLVPNNCECIFIEIEIIKIVCKPTSKVSIFWNTCLYLKYGSWFLSNFWPNGLIYGNTHGHLFPVALALFCGAMLWLQT